MRRNKCTIKADTSTRDLINTYANQLTAIENRKVTAGEVIERMAKGEDTLTRLKLGSLERRSRR